MRLVLIQREDTMEWSYLLLDGASSKKNWMIWYETREEARYQGRIVKALMSAKKRRR